jgi:hypothetical protein
MGCVPKLHPNLVKAVLARRFNSEVQQRCIDDMAEYRAGEKGGGKGAGIETARKAADQTLPSNELMIRWTASSRKPI